MNLDRNHSRLQSYRNIMLTARDQKRQEPNRQRSIFSTEASRRYGVRRLKNKKGQKNINSAPNTSTRKTVSPTAMLQRLKVDPKRGDNLSKAGSRGSGGSYCLKFCAKGQHNFVKIGRRTSGVKKMDVYALYLRVVESLVNVNYHYRYIN